VVRLLTGGTHPGDHYEFAPHLLFFPETMEVIRVVNREDDPISSLGAGLRPNDICRFPTDVHFDGGEEVGSCNRRFVQDGGKVYQADLKDALGCWCRGIVPVSTTPGPVGLAC
jgi:hypothetical protein